MIMCRAGLMVGTGSAGDGSSILAGSRHGSVCQRRP